MQKQTNNPTKIVKAPIAIKVWELRRLLDVATAEQKAWIETTLRNNLDGQTVYADRDMMEAIQSNEDVSG